MRKEVFAIALSVVAFGMVSCQQAQGDRKQEATESEQAAATERTEEVKAQVASTDEASGLKVETLKYKNPDQSHVRIEKSIDVPTGGDVRLVRKIGKWMGELMEVEDVDMTTSKGREEFVRRAGEAQLKSFTKEYESALGDAEYEIPQFSCEESLDMAYQTDSYIVYVRYYYAYLGGAHGMYSTSAYTFKTSDGVLMESFFDKGKAAAMQQVLSEGLIEYLKDRVEDPEDDLMGYYSLDDGLIPLPEAQQVEPTDSGLVVRYDVYQLGPYALGEPTFCIPYKKAWPLLTEEAKGVLR
ncbi:MAG: DUF4163 domain-containing protein [Bacteroidales bacterium]|nr:DUF4163 domain-containing protein [Bacteroidales bacterium]